MNKKQLYIAGLVGLSVVADVGIEMVYRSVDWDTRCEQAGWEKIQLDNPVDGRDYAWIPKGIVPNTLTPRRGVTGIKGE